MRQRVAAVSDRAAALRERLRPSQRRADQLWKVLIALAFALPIVAMGFEIFRQGYVLAGSVFAIIIVLWVAVLWWGWRQGYSGTAEPSPAVPAAPTAPSIQRPSQSGGRKSGGRQAGRK